MQVFLWSFERLPAGKESKQGDAPMIEKSEAADAYNGNLQLVYIYSSFLLSVSKIPEAQLIAEFFPGRLKLQDLAWTQQRHHR